MTQPPLELQEGQLVRVEYQEGRTQWWWAHYDDASVRSGEIGMLLGRTSDRWFENYRVRLIGRGHDVTFAARELNPCDLAAENETLRAQAEACQDTTDYDNAVTETVCDRLLEVIAGQGEPSFSGPRLNMIVRLIRDLRAQAEAGANGDHLTRAAAAYREARAPLDSLRAAETAATAVCYDHLGHYIGTREQYLAMHDAIDALAEQQGRVARAERDLHTAALAQADADAGGEAQ